MAILQVLYWKLEMIYLIPGTYCFPHEEFAELVRQKYSKDKIWWIYILITTNQVNC